MNKWDHRRHAEVVRAIGPKVKVSRSLRQRILKAARKAFFRSRSLQTVQSTIAIIVFTGFGVLLTGYYTSMLRSPSPNESERSSIRANRSRPTLMGFGSSFSSSLMNAIDDKSEWSEVEAADEHRSNGLDSLRKAFIE
ncbi:MAG: hypothetical protein CMJ78_02590 [Planctomycetaceae bacterium]|nr:hypothetical protein [Planctomycetaceae bacterium]